MFCKLLLLLILLLLVIKYIVGCVFICGSFGYLEVMMYRLLIGEWLIFCLDSELFCYYDFIVKFYGFVVDFFKCMINIFLNEGVENLVLVFCVSVL